MYNFFDIHHICRLVSEYAMWRKKNIAKGFGFNASNINHMKLDDIYDGCQKSYTSHYGAKGDGNIMDPINIDSFRSVVMTATLGEGVHFLMADYVVTTEDGQESIQEFNSKQLYLAQCVLALSVIMIDGNFVMKLLDIFTPFSVSLIFLMYKCFNEISIIKPNTLKSSNSERFLVCKYRREETEEIRIFLTKLNADMFNGIKDVHQFVPMEIILADIEFVNYLIKSNNAIGRMQILALKKIVTFHNDKSLIESRKMSIKNQCLNFWNLNDTKLCVSDSKMTSAQYFWKFTEANWCKQLFYVAGEKSVKSIVDFSVLVESVLDWKFVALNSRDSTSRTFYMSRGGSDVLMYNQKENIWVAVTNIKLEMPAGTIVFGEFVKEYTGEEKIQTSKTCFHIIDAIILRGRDISKLPLIERNRLCKMFTESLTKTTTTTSKTDDTVVIRTKDLLNLTSINVFYHYLKQRKMQNDATKFGLNINNKDVCNVFYVPTGIMLLNEVRSDMLKVYSKTKDQIYFFAKTTRLTELESDVLYESVYASFKNTFVNRFVWIFDNQDQYCEEKPLNAIKSLMYRNDIMKYITMKLEAGNKITK